MTTDFSVGGGWSRRTWASALGIFFLLLLVPIVSWVVLADSPPPPPPPPRSTLVGTAPLRPVASADQDHTRSLTGKVMDDHRQPISRAAVGFLAPGAVTAHPVIVTDEEGAFFLDGVPETAGKLTAKRSGYAAVEIPLEEGEADKNGLVLIMHEATGVKGFVLDSDGKPVEHALIRCDGSDSLMGTSGTDGAFEMAPEADGCVARASHPDFGASDPVKLQLSGKNMLELPSPGGISGTVVDERGQPVTAYLIAMESFFPADKQLDPLGGLSEKIDDPGGAFELKGLARGKYILTASAPGRPPAKSDSIEVEASRVTRGVRITLPKGAILNGTITDRATRKPIAGVRVSLDTVTSTGANGVTPVTSDENGNYSLDGVPTGPFSARFSHPDYRDKILSLDGRGKSEVRGDVDLQAGSGGSELSGIGATLGQGAGFVMITSVISDGPGEKAGLKSGDHISRIEGQSADTFTVADCVQRLRGPEGTTVAVTVDRGGTSMDFTVTRATIVR